MAIQTHSARTEVSTGSRLPPVPLDVEVRRRSPWILALLALFGLALALRVTVLHQIAGLPFFDHPVGDSAVYLQRAGEIVGGKLLPDHPFFYGSVFYPYFLAVVLSVIPRLFWVCALQIIAGSVLVVLLAILARRLYGTAAGLAAGAITALYGPLAFFEADVLGVVWGLLALVIGLLVCEAWRRPDGRRPGAALPWIAGAAFGMAATERPNLVVLVPLVAVWWTMHTPRNRRGTVGGFLVGAALPLALVAGLNVMGSGQWVPLTTSAGINLSIGYHPGATGTYEEPWEKSDAGFSARHTELEEASVAVASREAGHPLSAQAASTFWARKALNHVLRHPGEAVLLTLRKALLLLNNAEIPNHLDYAFIRDQATALRLMPVGFGILLVLATLGIGFSFLDGTRRDQTVLLLIVAGGALASVLPFFVADRYRTPMLPPLIVVAGAGVAAIIRLLSMRMSIRDRRHFPVLACALVAAVLAVLPLARPMKGRDYWMLAQAYQARGELPAAASAYEAAVREEGDNGELLNNLALVYRALGDRGRAVATLRKAVAAEPELAFPHKNLGMLLISQGEPDAALAELRAAARLDSTDAQVLGAMGALLAERGDRPAATAAFKRARALSPNDTRLSALIARYGDE